MFIKWAAIFTFAFAFELAWLRMWDTGDLVYGIIATVSLFFFFYALTGWDEHGYSSGDILVLEEHIKHLQLLCDSRSFLWDFPPAPAVSYDTNEGSKE